MYGGYHEISKGAYPRFGLEGWTEEGWPRHPPSFTPWKLACVWPPQARKHACGARNGGRRQQGEGGAHTCLHVLIPFSFWGLPRLPTPSPPPVTRPTLSPLLLACLRYSSGRANLASFTYAAAAFPPGPMPFSPSTLDTSRDLNSFYFPYISRSTTPSCCHPPASSTSLPTASLHPAPPLVGPRTTLRPRTEASSDVTFIPPVPFLPPTLSPPSSCGSFELYSLSDIVTNVRPICGGCVRFPPSHPPDTRGRLGDECLGSREDPLDRGRIPEVKREGSVESSSGGSA